jgi:hypothetical protein
MGKLSESPRCPPSGSKALNKFPAPQIGGFQSRKANILKIGNAVNIPASYRVSQPNTSSRGSSRLPSKLDGKGNGKAVKRLRSWFTRCKGRRWSSTGGECWNGGRSSSTGGECWSGGGNMKAGIRVRLEGNVGAGRRHLTRGERRSRETRAFD